MRIFVGYGYNERDAWIEDLVFPLIGALGCEPVHAKVAYGTALPVKVKEMLASCNAMIGFLTRRDQVGENNWSTHTWVVQELGAAYAEMPTIEVREEGIVEQLAMGNAYQRISVTETTRDRCLVELALAIAEIRQERSVKRIRLGPPDTAATIRPQLPSSAVCKYRLRSKNKESAIKQAEIIRIQGSLYVDIPSLTDDNFVELSVEAGGRVWRSDYEAVDAVEIKLA